MDSDRRLRYHTSDLLQWRCYSILATNVISSASTYTTQTAKKGFICLISATDGDDGACRYQLTKFSESDSHSSRLQWQSFEMVVPTNTTCTAAKLYILSASIHQSNNIRRNSITTYAAVAAKISTLLALVTRLNTIENVIVKIATTKRRKIVRLM